jgi:hypothetical protein
MSMDVFANAIGKAKPIAMRRCKWLVMEATSGNPTPDLATRFALRAISNYVHFGRCYSSKEIKKINQLVTAAALDRLVELDFNFDAWHSDTENEHPVPLNTIWLELLNLGRMGNDADSLTNWLYQTISECKMVTVLKTEHAGLSNHSKDWHARYANANMYPTYLLARPIDLCTQSAK